MNKRSRRFLSIFSAAALLLGGVMSGVSVAGEARGESVAYDLVSGEWKSASHATSVNEGVVYGPNGGATVAEAAYEYSENKYYPRVLEQQVELRAGESLYVVMDATTESNADFANPGAEWYMHITDPEGTEVGTFQRTADGFGVGIGETQRAHGLTLAYSYTMKNDWTADNADERLLENYTELQFFADGSQTLASFMTGVWAPGNYSPVKDLAVGVVNGWSMMFAAHNATYLARPVLQYTATTAGTYTVHAFAEVSANIYVLRDQRQPYTVVNSVELDHHTDPLAQTDLTNTSVTMEQGDALYFVLDPVANGSPVDDEDAAAEFQSLTIQKGGQTYATFGKYPESAAFGTQKGTGFIYGYSYTPREDWTAKTADEYLLDNYGMMSSYVPADVWDEAVNGFTTNYGGFANCATWRPVVSGVDLGKTCIVGNHFGSLVADTTADYIARPVLKFVAPSDGIYVISDSNYKEWGNTASTLYLLLEEPLNYDPVEAWRVTPDVISKDPTDSNFRLDATKYEEIAFPKYSKDDPARLVEYTDAQKKEQQVAGAEMKEKITKALDNGQHTVVIEPGVYRFTGESAIVLAGVKDFTIIGYGAELIVENERNAIYMHSCQNVTLVGFTIDRDPYYHVQFEITGFRYANNELVNGQRVSTGDRVGVLTVKVMDGYDPETVHGSTVRTDLAENDLMYGTLQKGILPGGKGSDDYSIQFFDKDGIWQQQVFTHYYGFKWVNETDRIGQYIGVDPIYLDEDDLTPLLGATIVPGGYRIISMEYSDSCNFVDIVNYGDSMMNYGDYNSGDCYYLRNKDIVRPGTNSLIAGGWGWVEFLSGGPIIEDCVYSRTNDDGADVMSWTDDVAVGGTNTEVIEVDTYRSKKDDPYEYTYKPGDVIRLYERETGTLLHEVTVTEAKILWRNDNNNQTRFELTLSEPVTVSAQDRDSNRDGIDDTFGDVVENYSRNRADQIVIKGTLFHDVFIRVLLQGMKTSLIENNVFIRIGCSAIQMPGGATAYNEGKSVENVTIRNNTFVDSPYGSQISYGNGLLSGAIAIGIDDSGSSWQSPNTTKSFRNVIIEENRFYGSMFSAILVKNVDGVVIRNNEINDPCTYDGAVMEPANFGQQYYGISPNAAILVYACDDVLIEGNTVNKADDAHCDWEIMLVTEGTNGGALSHVSVTGNTELLSLSNVGDLRTWTLNENPMDGYTCAVTVNGLSADVPGAVTVDGDKSIVVSRTAAYTVSAQKYLNTDDTTLWLVKLNGAEQQEGKTYTYNGKPMFWSAQYGAYCALVSAASEADAIAGKAVNTAGTATVVANAEGDINGTSMVDTNDAQAVYNLYSGYTAWDADAAERFLRSDANGDGKINLEDAVMIISIRLDTIA